MSWSSGLSEFSIQKPAPMPTDQGVETVRVRYCPPFAGNSRSLAEDSTEVLKIFPLTFGSVKWIHDQHALILDLDC